MYRKRHDKLLSKKTGFEGSRVRGFQGLIKKLLYPLASGPLDPLLPTGRFGFLSISNMFFLLLFREYYEGFFPLYKALYV
jgi:hypothetical protein